MPLLRELQEAAKGKPLNMYQELLLSHIKAELTKKEPRKMYISRKPFYWICALANNGMPSHGSHEGLLKVHSDNLEKTIEIHFDRDME